MWGYKAALTKNRTNGVEMDCLEVKSNVKKIMLDALWEGSQILYRANLCMFIMRSDSCLSGPESGFVLFFVDTAYITLSL